MDEVDKLVERQQAAQDAEEAVPDVPADWPPEGIPVNITREMRQNFQMHRGNVDVRVRVSGLKKTKSSVIARDIENIESQHTVLGVLDALTDAKNRWMGLECFKDISFDGFAPAVEGGDKMFADLRFMEEANFTLGVFTDAEKIAPEVKITKSNLFGLAYSAYCDIQPNKSAAVVLPQSQTGYGAVRSFLGGICPTIDRLVDAGAGAVLSRVALFRLGLRSNNPWVGNWQEYGVSRTKDTHTRNSNADEWVFESGTKIGFGKAVRQSLGVSSKNRILKRSTDNTLEESQVNAITYDAHVDRRLYAGQHAHPIAGWGAWLNVQAAGKYVGLPSPAGSNHVDHVKTEVKAHYILPILPPYLYLNSNAKVGAVLTPGGKTRSNDRFYLENDHIRGFTKIGDRYGDGGLKGGDVMAAASMQLCFPLDVPPLPSNALAGHFFINAGGVGNRASAGGLWGAVNQHHSSSYGFGIHLLSIPMLGAMGKLEFNFSFPWTGAYHADEFKKWKLGLHWAL